MTSIRRYIPVQLIVWIVACLILGAISGPIIQATATEEQLTRNVLLSAIPFILYFVAVVLVFIAVIVVAANFLDDKVPAHIYDPIEKVIIGGIVVGAVGMFQPWWFPGFRLGFYLLLIATLAFILWSHITPRGRHYEEEIGPVSVSEFERKVQ